MFGLRLSSRHGIKMSADSDSAVLEESMTMGHIIVDFFTSPINVALLGMCFFLLYKILKEQKDVPTHEPSSPVLSPMKKRDFTLEELREFDGQKGEGRILMAVNGKVFDVSRGKKFYGPGGPYEIFAGQDASRGLGTMSLDKSALKDEPDDLSDLSVSQLDIIRDWEIQFTEKYDYIGRLLKPGEEHLEYDDDGKVVEKND